MTNNLEAWTWISIPVQNSYIMQWQGDGVGLYCNKLPLWCVENRSRPVFWPLYFCILHLRSSAGRLQRQRQLTQNITTEHIMLQTLWGRLTHIYAWADWIILCWSNGLLLVSRQAITWTNDGLLSPSKNLHGWSKGLFPGDNQMTEY